jgi:hypothetical protein
LPSGVNAMAVGSALIWMAFSAVLVAVLIGVTWPEHEATPLLST